MKSIKVNLPCDSKQQFGGGFSFRHNLEEGLRRHTDIEVVNTVEEADVCLLAGVTMVTRQTVDKIQSLDKKLVVRLDNVPRNSRNRNTGTSRLKEFAQRADMVVWQCEWARGYLMDFIEREGVIIYNGIDEEVFKPTGDVFSHNKDEVRYMYSRFNRDENKRWEEAWYEFQLLYRENNKARLVIVGKFSPEQVEYGFDFFRGEKVEYHGIVGQKEKMASILRSCDFMLAPYFADCYSNSYLEYLMTGGELFKPSMTGGTPEILENMKKGREYNGLKRMAQEYESMFYGLL